MKSVLLSTKSLLILFLASQTITAATADERASFYNPPPLLTGQQHSGRHPVGGFRSTAAPLDRVASAVDGAESSHGTDIKMWRPDAAGPQGPMQVSEAAAADVGGGDRFDLTENRAIGRAYLLQLFWRYGNWPDAIAAYNWGIGKMDAWVKAGRPPDKFLVGVAIYLRRVLHESGLCEGSDTLRTGQLSGARSPVKSSSAVGEVQREEWELAIASAESRPDQLAHTGCPASAGWAAAPRYTGGSNRFEKKLDRALALAVSQVSQRR
jgi:Transglycosylase SLT domain